MIIALLLEYMRKVCFYLLNDDKKKEKIPLLCMQYGG